MKTAVIAELLGGNLFDCIKKVAEMEAEGIQLHIRGRTADLSGMSDSELRDLKAFCSGLNLEISALCGDFPGHGFQNESEHRARLDFCRKCFRVSGLLETRIMSMHIGVVPESSSDPIYRNMLKGMRSLAAMAEETGVQIAIESGPERSHVLKSFIEDCGSSALGVNFDPANLRMVLNEDSIEAAIGLAPLIRHVHVKDGVNFQKTDPLKVYNAFAEGGFEKLVAESGALFEERPLGAGAVDWTGVLAVLRKSGYNGFLTVERECGTDPEKDVRIALDFIKTELNRK